LCIFVKVEIRDAHGPGWPAGRAEISRPAGRNSPRKKQGLHGKTKFSYKTNINFTFPVEIF